MSHNLPIAIYGVVLIVAMLLWPTGIQGGVRAIAHAVRPASPPRGGRASPEPAKDEGVEASQL